MKSDRGNVRNSKHRKGSSPPNARRTRRHPVHRQHVNGGKQRETRMNNNIGVSPLKSAAAVVTVCNEESTIGRVLDELQRLPLTETIVVLNGCTDASRSIVMKYPGITMVHIHEPLGHDVGRSVGARMTQADAILFIDGDMRVAAEDLMPFLKAVQEGVDVALNDLSGHLPAFVHQDSVTRCKTFLNRLLRREDLGANSMTAVPHGLSRRCIETLGTGVLAVPPMAQGQAVLRGLKVSAVHTVDVIGPNRKRRSNTGRGNSMERLIVGDHAEAIAAVLDITGTSLGGIPATRSDIARGRNAL